MSAAPEKRTKTAAVIIEKWKLPIFTRHLENVGYLFELRPGVTDNTYTLRVAYEWVAELQPIIEAAQQECANATAPKCQHDYAFFSSYESSGGARAWQCIHCGQLKNQGPIP